MILPSDGMQVVRNRHSVYAGQDKRSWTRYARHSDPTRCEARNRFVGWYRSIDWYRPAPRAQVIQLDGGYTLNIYAEAQPSLYRSGVGAPNYEIFTGIALQLPRRFTNSRHLF